MAEESTRHERGLVTEEAEPKLKQPPLYQVVLLNDDYTPMEFVVDVLEKFFAMDRPAATRIMLAEGIRRPERFADWYVPGLEK